MSRLLSLSGLRLLVFGLMFAGIAPLGAQAQSTFELSDLSGAELFLRFCSSCHGEFARGDGPVAGTLAVAVPDLTRISARRGGTFPTQDVREIVDGRAVVVAHGTRYMPVWGYEFWWDEGADKVAETQARQLIDELVEYLRAIQQAD